MFRKTQISQIPTKNQDGFVSDDSITESLQNLPNEFLFKNKQEISPGNIDFDGKINEILKNDRDLNIYNKRLEDLIESRTESLIDANQKLITEIKEKRITERKLIEEKNKFQMYLDIAAIMIIVLDKSGYVKLINKKGCKILGYDEKDIVGKNWFDKFIPDDEKQKIRNVQFNILSNNIEKFQSFENYILTRNGQKRLISWNNAVMKDSNDEITATISSGEDITEKRYAEEIIKKMNTELEERVHERTKELEMLNKDLESFSYSISHDLRAPLRHIQGFSELLQNHIKDEDEQSVKYLNKIIGSSLELSKMIEKLLEFSKLGRKVLKITFVNMNLLVSEVLLLLEEEINNRNIVWDIGQLPKITADEQLIKVVLTNLIGNAIKYTGKKDEARIEIGYYPRAKDNVFYIKDDGSGFDMTYSEKLFGVFQRLHNTEEFDGTGVGLANVKRIINKHGGQVWATAKVNKGATFFFSVPLNNKQI